MPQELGGIIRHQQRQGTPHICRWRGFFPVSPVAVAHGTQHASNMNRLLLISTLLTLPVLQGCTVLAIADVAASTVIYGVKTAVNVVDAVTPDIVNKDKKKKD